MMLFARQPVKYRNEVDPGFLKDAITWLVKIYFVDNRIVFRF
jgi:hypothetical protein